ncbi:bifunctional serine/threonine-protein kinase/ABC transporter substrate-binding protein [Streptomyces sp. CNS654]|uniref:bifunctional serine/threonine-protein kinase/ABC transporter substrate-binding protein n=1 Tax=Streptomyces sp. CNS654 TaxID=1506995 RepID=UPI000515EFAA|nr:bifunctional serine/threonine-protein kinase/ABC transporter substrate-binding protein [Streptomyces sp. CNS654]
MRPLTREDPRTVGPYRTLARLGAGGMGVVYLARSPGGALAAVKVIRAEHAADPGFRTRFRREAEAAGRITGPWVVPVLDADSGAREPWLATAFVPGPSLAQVVAADGPLPTVTVRALGSRLAEVLVAVHEAGLVHRDVKPGNVLLALDGPRLIDFGIARHEGVTALTGTGAVVGTPGYLAPEQAVAGPVGPPCDVFSLGCVLAYATTGRRPFGEGGAAGVLFRTVHEEPDLTGVPPELLPLIAACLSKDPNDRPRAGRIGDDLVTAGPVGGGAEGARVPAQGRWGAAGASDGAADADADGGAEGASGRARGRWGAQGLPEGPPPPEPDTATPPPWFAPPGLAALVAERSAAALALPDPEPPPVTPPPDESEAPASTAGLARRRFLIAGGAAAVVFTGGATAAWLAGRQSGGTGPGSGAPPTYTIGLQADLSGPGRGTGLAHRRGVLLAIADHNARAGTTFRLTLRTEDDAGDPHRALRAAGRLGADPDVIATIGPTGAELAADVVQRYAEQRLALVVVAAGSTTATETNAHLCVTRPYDRMLTPGLIGYVAHTRPAERVLLVQDGGGTGLAGELGSAFRNSPPADAALVEHVLPPGDAGFAATARRTVADRADAVVFAGGDGTRAGRLATALAGEGYTGSRIAAGPALGPAFLDEAGEAADGWVFAEAYADPAALPSARSFTAAHRERFGSPPATWAAEAYDAVGLIARAAAGITGDSWEMRVGMARRLLRTEHQGVVRLLAFRSSIRQVRYENGIFLYRIENGRPRFLGPFGEVRETSDGSGR